MPSTRSYEMDRTEGPEDMAEFDVKRVTPLEWAGIGAGVLAFIVSFFPWASLDFGDEFGGFAVDLSGNAWDAGFAAWFSCLLLLGAAVGYVLGARATDSTGRTQPIDAPWTRGGFANNSIQRVEVVVVDE